MIDFRTANEEDIDTLCDLYLDFHEFHVAGVPERLETIRRVWDDERVRLAGRLQEIIGNSDSAVLVAEEEGNLLGFCELYVREDKRVRGRVARRYCHLQSMFVTRQRRRTGIGRRLLAASESWAKSQDASEMRLDTWEFPEGPLGFYERCGYRTYRRSLTRDLGAV
jgi:GNAT superfamily N-acetyltransferase